MCAPALMIISGVLAAASSVYQGQMQGAAYEAQANAASQEARNSVADEETVQAFRGRAWEQFFTCRILPEKKDFGKQPQMI